MTVVGRICGNRRAAWVAASLLVILTFLAQTARLAEPDMAYFLYSAGRLLDGARLYRDVVDMNPPAIFALNLPVVWLARAAHLPDILVYRLATVIAVGGLLLFVRRLSGRYLLPSRPAERRCLLLLVCLVLFPLPGEDFGQREHFVLALLLPYLAIVIARLDRQPVAGVDATAAGALAGLALALKPPFVIVWLAGEAWYRLVGHVEPRRLTPEVWGVLAVGAAYVVAVLTLTPDYVRLVFLLGSTFTSYLRSSPLQLLVFAPGALLTAFAALAVIATRRVGQDSRARTVLAVAMLGSFLAAVAQQKDLRYHFYPAFALATLLLGLIAGQSASRAPLRARVYARIAKCAVWAITLVVLASAVLDALGGSAADRRRRAEFGGLLEAVRDRARGEPVGVLSYHMGSAFPLVNYAHVVLASRFACLWILPATYWDALTAAGPIRYHTPAETKPAERLLNEAVVEDLLGARPRLLLILRPFPDERPYGFRRLNYVAYFARDPRLSEFFSGYQFAGAQGQYDLYERLGQEKPRAGPPPLATVPPLPTAPGQFEQRPAPVDLKFVAGSFVFVVLLIASAVLEARPARRSLPDPDG
jgi:hypothetical protein